MIQQQMPRMKVIEDGVVQGWIDTVLTGRRPSYVAVALQPIASGGRVARKVGTFREQEGALEAIWNHVYR